MELAQLARHIAGQTDALYHGTRNLRGILATGKFVFGTSGGDPVVCMTRSPEEAARWATLERDDDEGRGAILVLSRASLQTRYRVRPFHDEFWDNETYCYDEAEERIWRRDVEFAPHLIGIVAERQRASTSREHRLRAHLSRKDVQEHPGRRVKRPTEDQCAKWKDHRRSELLSDVRARAQNGDSAAVKTLALLELSGRA
jgi:hypothetical protein